MSHHGNENMLERLFEDGLDMSTQELAKALELDVDALGTKSFADCEYDGNPDHKILFTGYDIFSHEELATQYANSQFENGPEGYA